jgi:type IV conjugative transfer system protein TraL
MEQTEVPIPIFLNEPDKIIFWTWFEVFAFLGIFFLVWILCSFFLGVVLGLLVIRGYRLAQKSPWGDLTTVGVYWFLPSNKHYQSLPPSYIREFIG